MTSSIEAEHKSTEALGLSACRATDLVFLYTPIPSPWRVPPLPLSLPAQSRDLPPGKTRGHKPQYYPLNLLQEPLWRRHWEARRNFSPFTPGLGSLWGSLCFQIVPGKSATLKKKHRCYLQDRHLPAILRSWYAGENDVCQKKLTLPAQQTSDMPLMQNSGVSLVTIVKRYFWNCLV